MYAKRATASSSSSNNLDANTEETKENFSGSILRDKQAQAGQEDAIHKQAVKYEEMLNACLVERLAMED